MWIHGPAFVDPCSTIRSERKVTMSNTNTSSRGISFGSLLCLAFIVLKLSGHIDWSWWWVLSPIWIGFVIAMIALVVMLIIYLRTR